MPSVADAIILCGGAGTRLRSVTGEAPKSLASIGGRPFLDILISQLRRHAFHHVILAVGYQSELIRSHFENQEHELSLDYSIEQTPLGTGGALRNAVGLMESDCALIMNGDSYTDADLSAFAASFIESRPDLSVLVVPADGRVDCGLVSVDSNSRVLGFKEKQSATGTQYVNAGIYMVTKSILCDVTPNLRVSLEEELFPQWLAQRRHIRAFNHPGKCIDIGTPERYLSAQETLSNAERDGIFSGPKRQLSMEKQ
jgi:D-glycero-alpha-D-manno-heptose 1-phosphate guanylyltransferase